MRYLAIALFLMACVPDETISSYVIPGETYVLAQVNDVPTDIRATISFEANGKISGQAPCNRYFTTSEDPYPWLKIGPIGATKMACPDLKQETEFFQLLESMTLSEASGPVLLLSNDDGQTMTFRVNS